MREPFTLLVELRDRHPLSSALLRSEARIDELLGTDDVFAIETLTGSTITMIESDMFGVAGGWS